MRSATNLSRFLIWNIGEGIQVQISALHQIILYINLYLIVKARKN